jgi:hypothetical protein
MVQLRSAHRLAAVVVALGLIGGIALILAGAQYGLSSRSGVGPGTFPAAAGVLLTLASVLWGIGLLRTPPPAAAPLLEAGLGTDLTHRIGEVERRADGHIELDESVTATAVDVLDEDDPEPPAPVLSPTEARSGRNRVLLVIAAVAVAAILLDTLGFVLVMTLQLTAILIAAGRQRWWKAVLVGLTTALVTRFVFGELLGVILPSSGIPLLSTWGI